MKGKILNLVKDGEKKEVLLRFGIGAFQRFENLTGKKLTEADTSHIESDLSACIAAGTGYSVDETNEMIDNSDYSFRELVDITNRALLLAATGKEEVEEKN